MPNDTIMKLDKELAQLEMTVAEGFQEQGRQLAAGFAEHGRLMDRVEVRIASLETRLEDFGQGLKAVIAEMRRSRARRGRSRYGTRARFLS